MKVPLVLSPRYTARFSAVADKRLASWNNRGQSEIAKIVSWCQSITVNDLRLHYTTENACHVTIHAGKTIEMYKYIPYFLDGGCIYTLGAIEWGMYLYTSRVQQWAWCNCLHGHQEYAVWMWASFQTKTGSAAFSKVSGFDLESARVV